MGRKGKKSGTGSSAPNPGRQDDAPPAYGSSTNTTNGTAAPPPAAAPAEKSAIPTPVEPVEPSPTPVAAPAVSARQSPAFVSDKASQAAPATTRGPTVDAPFDFPSDAPPSYSAASSSFQQQTTRPIAVPQSSPTPASPFVPAYSPALLARGITAPSWHAFVATLSAFLSASVSDRALGHAADVARRVGDHPAGFAKNLASQVQQAGRGITNEAKSGNIIGAAFKLVGAVISIPIHAAVGTAATAVSLPGVALSAAASKPQTPRGRAAAYLVVANQDWLAARGLQADLMDSRELSALVGASVTNVVDAARGSAKRQGPGAAASIQLKALEDYIAELEIDKEGVTLDVGDTTLWLVLRHVAVEKRGSAN